MNPKGIFMSTSLSTSRLDEQPAGSLADAVLPHLDDIRARARETDQARRPLQENIDLMRNLGIIRALVPRRYGGLEHDVFDWLQTLRVLSRADMSVGWFAGLASSHGFALTKFSERLQDEVWGQLGPDAIISTASAVAEGGTAQRVDGGYQLSGRWRFASGLPAADWVIALVKVPDETTGQEQPHWAFLPRADFSVDDTWHVAGMRGSGSHDLVVSDVFVPEHRLSDQPGVLFEPVNGVHKGNPLYDLPFAVIYPIAFAPVVLGGAEAVVELHTQQLQKRKAALTGVPLVESPLAQVRLAEATMRLRAVAVLQEDRWRQVAHRVHTASTSDPEELLWWRVTDAYVGRETMRIVEHIVDGAGASIYFETNPLQRFWRDMHSAGGHTWFSTESAMQILGRHLLDLPADPRLI
jgi:3-hydroxy-9,10-secoandrosta-1,3,5(10)-triene-9,17-dione monooxygenase